MSEVSSVNKNSLWKVTIIWLVIFLIDMYQGNGEFSRVIWYILGIVSLIVAAITQSRRHNIKSEFRHIGLVHFTLFVSTYTLLTYELPFGFLNPFVTWFIEKYPFVFLFLIVISAPVILIILRFTYYANKK